MSIELNPAAKKGMESWRKWAGASYILARRSTTRDENTGGLRVMDWQFFCRLETVTDEASFTLIFQPAGPGYGNTPSETCQGQSKSVHR
ncbi:hypothetical protein KXW38_006303 [Aspergillus fumigatus]|nr:hypothetical protein KXW38_006303 [Aspergillus fumigatus]